MITVVKMHPDYNLSTTIKRVYLDAIRSGDKTIEYKAASDWWRDRLGKAQAALKTGGRVSITFVCGRDNVDKYNVPRIELKQSAAGMNIDGNTVYEWYEIHLGEVISCTAK